VWAAKAFAMSLGVTAGLMGPAAAQPIRVFVGLESAATEAERVALALAELDRTGAFDRELLMVISPTGTDYVNYVAVETAAYLTRGDMASVAMQCSLRPSPLSLDRVAEGRRHYRMLNDAIHNALTQRPPAARGGPARGEPGRLDQPGRLRPPRHPGPAGRRHRPGDLDRHPYLHEQVEAGGAALGPARRRPSLVGRFGLDLLVRAPDWLGPAANVVPGQFQARGHDYRADLARFIR
jgi:hypothetical protein